jgi:hypothetical protein
MAILPAILIVATLAGADGGNAAPRIFLTSVAGNGNLSTWPDASGASGLAAADAICRARANAASLANANDYVALISDTTNDAYCRWHGAGGTLATNCGEATLPSGAGPWFRMDGLAAMDVAENAIGTPPDDGGYVPRPIMFDEFGNLVPDTNVDIAFTATGVDGRWEGLGDACAGWTSDDASDFVAAASAYYGYSNVDIGGTLCDRTNRLVCLEKGRDGTALTRRRPPSARIAFVTSSTGSGDLSTWPDAGGATSLAAGDAICRAHASRAQLPLADTYKAWLSTTSVDAVARFANDGPFYRVDGVLAIASVDRLAASHLDAPVQSMRTATSRSTRATCGRQPASTARSIRARTSHVPTGRQTTSPWAHRAGATPPRTETGRNIPRTAATMSRCISIALRTTIRCFSPGSTIDESGASCAAYLTLFSSFPRAGEGRARARRFKLTAFDSLFVRIRSVEPDCLTLALSRKRERGRRTSARETVDSPLRRRVRAQRGRA